MEQDMNEIEFLWRYAQRLKIENNCLRDPSDYNKWFLKVVSLSNFILFVYNDWMIEISYWDRTENKREKIVEEYDETGIDFMKRAYGIISNKN